GVWAGICAQPARASSAASVKDAAERSEKVHMAMRNAWIGPALYRWPEPFKTSNCPAFIVHPGV
ncbi:hypothetical protein ACPWSH_24435, partial [Pandoraea pneumonica]|uniref:hypothetical protein n=1 Tax=Pandoraea pneumonica TaxID=2508299 RepID=UPI003CF804D4